jgi:DNA-directed RNA polymerase sigma subunit (sigma70/sigma32)
MLADEIGVTRERIRQIESSAIRKLRLRLAPAEA